MFKAGDWERALDCALDSPATTAAIAMAVLLLVPALPNSGVSGTESRDAPRPGAYHSQVAGTYNYQMRCWQHGHLLFEQNLGELPSGGSQHPLEVSGTDRHGRPVYAAESTNNATCLIRSVANSGAPPQP
jgi:hypothetical protein